MAYIKRIKLPNVTESYDIYDPSAVHSVNNKTGTEITLSATDIGLGNVDNVKQYSSTNPPPYPVTSVNGRTGPVTLGANDIGALPLTGGIMSGIIDMNGAKITNVGTPTEAQDAVNKAYADSVKGVEVLTQSVEPTTQITGDFWFQES